jgi:N-acetylneuraminic acid mutarotase
MRSIWHDTIVLGILICACAGSAQAQTEAKGGWASKAAIPVMRNEVVAVAAGGKIYVLGGNYPGAKYDVADNAEYDPQTDKWRDRAPMPQGVNHVGATELNGKIYTVGGFNGPGHATGMNYFFEYDPATDTWKTLPPLPVGRGSISVASAGGKIHAFGGRKIETEMTVLHDIYDPATGKWSEGPPLSKGRDHMTAVTADGKIHVIGGRYGKPAEASDLRPISGRRGRRFRPGAAAAREFSTRT